MLLLNRNFTFFLFCFLLLTTLSAQTPDIIPLSKKVGLTVDAEENIFFRIFPDIDGFYSAQFYDAGKNKIIIQIVFIDFSQRSVRRRSLTMKEFIELQHHVDVQPPITDRDRAGISQNLTYITTVNILESIPPDQFIIIKHRTGKKIRGALIGVEKRQLSIQTPISVEKIPIWDMASITYRKKIRKLPKLKGILYTLSGLGGVILAEVWNEQTRPRIDQVWHFRFIGTVLGMLAGAETYQAVNIISSPKTFFALTPEEMDKLKN